MKAPFKHFDLPSHHLTGDRHYVPPKARKSEEIERRKALPTGALLAEHQLRGIRIASSILERVVEKPDLDFTAKIISAGGINSSWYGFARGSQVMRRRLQLPYLAGSLDTPPPTGIGQLSSVRQSFEEAGTIAGSLVSSIETRSRRTNLQKRLLGRALGDASLSLACITLGRSYSMQSDPYDIQAEVRQQGLTALEAARTLEAEIGTPPSLAQLADTDSDLAVYIRRNAPNAVFEAYEEALAAPSAA